MPYYVYVVALAPEAALKKKFRAKNPDMKDDAECFYVGQSIHDPDCRYRQHKECHGDYGSFKCICGAVKRPLTKSLSNRLVREFGRCLSRGNYEQYNPLKTRAQAERLEEELAMALQTRGCGVWWS